MHTLDTLSVTLLTLLKLLLSTKEFCFHDHISDLNFKSKIAYLSENQPVEGCQHPLKFEVGKAIHFLPYNGFTHPC